MIMMGPRRLHAAPSGLVAGALLAAGAWAGAVGGAREAALVWAALVAAPLGAGAMLPGPRRGLNVFATGLPVVALWLLAGWPSGGGRAPLALPADRAGSFWTAVTLTGLFAFGAACARLAGRRPAARATAALALLLVAAGLHGAIVRGGLGRAPWPPAIAARALDAAPTTLVLEAAGYDWLRRPALYGPAGADSIGPSERTPWRPALAGATALVLGCLASVVAFVAARRTETP